MEPDAPFSIGAGIVNHTGGSIDNIGAPGSGTDLETLATILQTTSPAACYGFGLEE
jgi:hypothetical protein